MNALRTPSSFMTERICPTLRGSFSISLKKTDDSDSPHLRLSTLSTLSIDPAANYSDSPEALAILLPRIDVTNFRTSNPTSNIDMFLIPSKSIDSTSIVNSADWIVNFYGDSTSLVLWINSTSGEVKNLAEL